MKRNIRLLSQDQNSGNQSVRHGPRFSKDGASTPTRVSPRLSRQQTSAPVVSSVARKSSKRRAPEPDDVVDENVNVGIAAKKVIILVSVLYNGFCLFTREYEVLVTCELLLSVGVNFV